MALIANDPWFITAYVLGWGLFGTLGIFLFALILRGFGALVGARRKLRLRTFQISMVAFVIAITVFHLVTFRDVHIYWDDIVLSYYPVVLAPIVAFLGNIVWPRREREGGE